MKPLSFEDPTLHIVSSENQLVISLNLMKGNRKAIVGHSIEVRIVAEDPSTGFLPSTGRVVAWAEPKSPGIRVDTGFGPNSEITRFYDSLIAKVISLGETRSDAIEKLKFALLDFHVLGIKTNIGYLVDVLSHPEFVAGRMDTGFLGREFGEWTPGTIPQELGAIAASATSVANSRTTAEQARGVWQETSGFRNTA